MAANDDDDNQFHVPLFKNRDNKTALDYTLNYCGDKEHEVLTERNEKKSLMLNLVESKSKEHHDHEMEEAGTIYRKSAELILKHIGAYPFNLFKVEIKHLVSIMIE